MANTLNNFTAASRKRNFVPFNIYPAGTDLSWISNNEALPPKVLLTGTVDGVNAAFSAGQVVGDHLLVWNGLVQQQDVDYTLDGTGTFTFTTAPEVGARIWAYLGA
jgi:hypothetical protein